eukprot:CAMPEP_0198425644 /NCGR_PEP_ID=MMETSP1452-20131203/4693_1 /TAXON_ID=1181717 /ORGANISM="Synchroma pusillum, Strain CCMP3072" /LENGTH=144 /DNA_ID=CAMNT_0044146003 /DNA_START=111 /DNA_END=545 /DNA_ORIENTATION=+
MPKNKGKGGKNWKKGKKADLEETRRELVYRDEGQEYAQVVKMLGDGRCDIYCFDGQARKGLIRGTMRRRVWINVGDIILVSLREFQDDKADVIHKYSTEEARVLKQQREIPESVGISVTATDLAAAADGAGVADDEIGFSFEGI